MATLAGEVEAGEPIALDGAGGSAVEAEWAPEPAAADEGGPAPDGAHNEEEEEEAPSWEAVAEAAWGASAASSWTPSEGPDGGAEVEPEDGLAQPEASVVAGAVGVEAMSSYHGDDHEQASAHGIVGAGLSVATELERPDLGPSPVGLMAAERAVSVEDTRRSRPRRGPPGRRRRGRPRVPGRGRAPTLQELFWGEN